MCDPRPGDVCAHDTASLTASARAAYLEAYPDGPAVDPVTKAAESFRPSAQG